MNPMKNTVSKSCMVLRHGLVRLLAPKMYRLAIRGIDMPRPMTISLRENIDDKPLTGVEIGVFVGENAYSMLTTLKIQKMYLVDPYLPYTDPRFPPGVDICEMYQVAMKRLSKYHQKIRFIKTSSDEAVNYVPDFLDFVYIDGDHGYDHVKQDIRLYYPKVRKGGMLGGHDFNIHYIGVCRAVTEFASTENLELHGDNMDWWIIKP